ncbi:threonine synthase [Bosea sp. NPDC055332]
MSKVALNPRLVDFVCIRCDQAMPVGDYVEGCPSCLAQGYPAGAIPRFKRPDAPFSRSANAGMAGFSDRLCYERFVSFGEGDTPLRSMPGIARELGLASLLIKDEGANPTGSHKDRMSAQAVARAVDIGARGIIAASSGNGGLSIATYAKACGLPCQVVVTPTLPERYREAMLRAGAQLHVEADSLARWRYVSERVRSDGWLPATNYLNPPVGSHPIGVDAYKTIAYELLEDPAAARADAIIVPTARGDLLWGLWRGLLDQQAAGQVAHLPRLVAVDPFPRLSRVIDGADYRGHFAGTSALAAINGPTVTLQSLKAVGDSGGAAIVVSDAEAERDRARLRDEGIQLELSSAAALSAARRLVAQEPGLKSLVLIGTARSED